MMTRVRTEALMVVLFGGALRGALHRLVKKPRAQFVIVEV